METEKILLEIKVDNADVGEAIKKSGELGKALEELKAKQKQVEAEFGKGSAQYEEVAASIRALRTEQRDLQKEIDNNVKMIRAEDGSLNQLKAQLATLTAQYGALSEAEREQTKFGQELSANIAGITAKLKEQEAAYGDHRRNVGNYTESILSAIRAGKAEEVALKDQKELVKKLSKERETASGQDRKRINDDLRLLQQSIGQAEGKLDEFGDKVAKGNKEMFNTFSDLGEGVVSAFEITPLLNFAGESQEAAEIQAHALKAIAAAQAAKKVAVGLSSLADIKDMAVQKLKIIVLGAENAAIQKLTFSTAGLAVGQKALTLINGLLGTSFTMSAGAVKLFGKALIATGIGAIVVLIGELIANFDTLVAAVENFFGKSKELSAEDYKNMAEQARKNSDLIREMIDVNNSMIRDDRKRRLKETEEEYRRQIDDLKHQIANDVSIRENGLKLISALEKKKSRELQDITKEFDEKEDKERQDKLKKAAEAAEKAAAIAAKNRERRIQIELDGGTKELTLFDHQTKEQIRSAKKAGEDVNLVIALRNKERIALVEKLNKENDEKIREAKLRELNAARDLIEATLQIQVEGSQAQLDQKLLLLQKEREIELKQKDLTDGQRFMIENKYRELEKEARNQYNKSLADERNLELTNELARLEMQGMDTVAKKLELAEFERDQLLENDKLTAAQREQIQIEYEKRVAEIAQQALEDDMARMEQKAELANVIAGGLSSAVSAVAGQSAAAAEFAKAIAVFQIGIDTAKSLSQIVALATAPSADNIATGGLAVPIKIATLSATVLANIAQARKMLEGDAPQPSFYEGGMYGYTGDGNPRSESMALGKKPYKYHKKEMIVPDRVLSTPEGSYHGAALYSLMKKTEPRFKNVPGFADGGMYVRSITTSVKDQANHAADMINLKNGIKNLKVYTRITDIQKVTDQATENKAISSLG